MITISSGLLLYYALKWILGVFIIVMLVLFISTDGEIFSELWNQYRQGKNLKNNSSSFLYHWLTEEGTSDLPISTNQYLQGVEIDNTSNEEIYYIHLKHRIDNIFLEHFESSVRQIIQQQSNCLNDCVVSKVQREPFEAIKIRVCRSCDLTYLRAQENIEDF